MAKKTYVFDTSVCLTDFKCIYNYGNNNIILPLKVLEEIDNHKKRQDAVGANARMIIRELDEFRGKGSLQDGVRIAKGKGILKVETHSIEDLPLDLAPEIADHIIISTALKEHKQNTNRKTILVSRDINMRVICDSIGLLSEDYTENQIIKKESELYSGFMTVLVDDQIVEQFCNEDKLV